MSSISNLFDHIVALININFYTKAQSDNKYLTSSDITGKENTSNKVNVISSSSTNTQYPGAKAVYDYINDAIGDIEGDMLL